MATPSLYRIIEIMPPEKWGNILALCNLYEYFISSVNCDQQIKLKQIFHHT